MAKRFHLAFLISAGILCVSALWVAAQESAPENSVIRKVVDMVRLNVAVPDGKGNSVAGIHRGASSIMENRIPETIATFEEGNEAPRAVVPGAGEPTLIARFPA